MLKNLSIDYSKRPWKTPSPSTATSKSPRYLRAGLFNKISSKNYKPEISTDVKSKPMLHSFKNQLVQSKQQANRISSCNPNDQPSSQSEPYNAYFNSTVPTRSTLPKPQPPLKTPSQPQQQNSSSIPLSGTISTTLSASSSSQNSTVIENQVNQVIPSLMRSRPKYDDVVKKYMNQATETKNMYRELFERYEKLQGYCESVEGELGQCRREIDRLRNKYEDKKVKQRLLNQQILKLRQQIQKYTQQLKLISYQTPPLTKQSSTPASLSSSSSPSPSSPLPVSFCQQCKSRDKLIITLNNSLQYKMHEVGKKDTIISSLVTDLQKVDLELKMFDKPKNYMKKICNNIQEINEIVMINKAKELSNRIKDKGNF